ncbi:Alpha amylase catalytic domain protein [Clostridium bornimense]|uniref:Alpha amylase catalytic domain protein n=2 Tax=Clostridium bornimense TaxID=1216932 RepID=W6SEG4_9CLOT|nr:Alpha amylase catalytic domain protein [Clostridium bornimense]
MIITTISGCNIDNKVPSSKNSKFNKVEFNDVKRNKTNMDKKQGVYYEIFVRSFADSDGDGIGDLNGVTEKLSYLKELGVDGIWLMPVTESESYHGYDVIDYKAIEKDYGTMEDFQKLLEEAHKLNIKVIMDLVINHTSSSHPWFKESASSPNSKYRDYYRWVTKDDKDNYVANAVSDFGSGDVWHNKNGAYYYGIFWSEMPDLNFNNEAVRSEIKDIAKFWLKKGIDGFRLDAARHIYGVHEFEEESDPLNKNLQWWNEFATACEEVNKDVYLVGECWDEEKKDVAAYVQPFDTIFNFDVSTDLSSTILSGKANVDGKEFSKSLEEIYNRYDSIDDKFIDGVFATNHDQNRIMSMCETEEKAQLAAMVYMTLPGNPYIYYGEEIGMKGMKPDENIREPFVWTSGRKKPNTTWESSQYNEDLTPLDKQKNDKNSMYNFYKKIIDLRKSTPALYSGDYKAIEIDNNNVMAYERSKDNNKVYVIHNFSEKEQQVTIEGINGMKVIYSRDSKDSVKGDAIKVEPLSSIVISN